MLLKNIMALVMSNGMSSWYGILPPATSSIQSAIVLHINTLVLKKHFSRYLSLFCDAVHGKSIEHLHLYAYEVISRHHHYICQLLGVAIDLALRRRFIRAIFSHFLYSFSPHTHPACDVQAGGFD